MKATQGRTTHVSCVRRDDKDIIGRPMRSRFVQDERVSKIAVHAGLLVVGLVAFLPGCATTQAEVARPYPLANPSAIIISVDGAGGFQATTAALRRAVQEELLPLQVDAFEWTHGYGRVLADQTDFCYARAEGRRLAATIVAYWASHPGKDLYLIGHSAGSAVALAAAECLPPNSVRRIVLLSPSVSADYDVTPALRCAREGVDVFYSGRDWGYLGIGVTVFGTADRRWSCPAAGRVGFRMSSPSAESAVLCQKLRQHAWHPCVVWTGNCGGHYDGYRDGFLRAYVLPLLTATDVPAGPVPCLKPHQRDLAPQ